MLDDAELRRALVAELRAAVDAARRAAGEVDRGTIAAVHDFRKALRRARAVLALVAGSLPRSDARAVLRALREVRRALGPARDHAVAPDAVSQLALDDAALATARAVLDAAARAEPDGAHVAQTLAEGAARAAAQLEILEAALPAEVDWDTVVDGVRRVYRAARRARRDARGRKRAFHRWRRRSKELKYQLDVLARLTPAAAELEHQLDVVVGAQSAAVDLIMLRAFVRAHGEALERDARDHLIDAIDDHLAPLMKAARRAGRDWFRAKPSQLAKQLHAATRRDHGAAEG